MESELLKRREEGKRAITDLILNLKNEKFVREEWHAVGRKREVLERGWQAFGDCVLIDFESKFKGREIRERGHFLRGEGDTALSEVVWLQGRKEVCQVDYWVAWPTSKFDF